MKAAGKVARPAVLALLCALPVAGVQHWTRDEIADNQQRYEERALREMVAGASVIRQGGRYIALEDGETVAFILPAATREGYNGRIDFYVALDLAGRILGVRVIHHQETPGIGDGIDHEVSDWMLQFRGRSLERTAWALAPEGDFDAITGATITSRAMVHAVRQTLSP